MRWFQYKPGQVGETERVAHYEVPSTDDGLLVSRCGDTFDPKQTEEAAEPGKTPVGAQVKPCAPCIKCLFLAITATEAATATDTTTQEPVPDAVDAVLRTAIDDSTSTTGGSQDSRDVRAVAVLLRKALWLLDDASFEILSGRYSAEQAAELTRILEDLARIMREIAGLPVAIEVERGGQPWADTTAHHNPSAT